MWSNPCRRYVSTNTDEIFKDLPNVFGISDDILIVGYASNGKDQDLTLQKVLQICRRVNLKLMLCKAVVSIYLHYNIV